MRKLKIALLCLLVTPAIIILGTWILAFVKTDIPSTYPENYKCPFCNEKVLEVQTYYEGKLVSVLLNYAPILPGQSMIIPKRHVARLEDLTAEEFAEIRIVMNRVQKAFEKVYGTSDYLLCCQNGINAGQTAYHTHLHMIPRKEQSVVTKMELWWGMLSRPLYDISPLSAKEVKAQAKVLAEAMENE